MRRSLSSTAVLSIIFLVWTTGTASGFSLGLSGLGEARISAGQGFGPKMQYGGGGAIDMRFPVLSWLDVTAGFELAGIAPSDLSGGFAYRGISPGAIAVGADARSILGSWKGFGELAAGGGLALAGVLAGYQYTSLYFFYPEVRTVGFLDYTPAFLPAWRLRLSLPLAVQLRRDMDYSFSAAIELGVAYTFGSGK